MTRLDAQFGVSETFRVGVADFRGDGRPDYFYQASLLYSDTVTPARLSLAGGVTTLNGIGFNPGLQVSGCRQQRQHAFRVGEPDPGGCAFGHAGRNALRSRSRIR